MPTAQQAVAHMRNSHSLSDAEVLSGLTAEGSLEAYHDALHVADPTLAHSHDPVTGEIVTQSKALAGGRTATLTDDGWSLDGTPVEVLQTLSVLIDDMHQQVVFVGHPDGKVEAFVDLKETIRITATSFADATRVILGECLVWWENNNG